MQLAFTVTTTIFGFSKKIWVDTHNITSNWKGGERKEEDQSYQEKSEKEEEEQAVGQAGQAQRSEVVS